MKIPFSTTLRDAALMCNGIVKAGRNDLPVRSISSDSRDIGPASLFVALEGEQFDGHDFIPSLLDNDSLSLFLVHRMPEEYGDKGVILCEDTLAALGEMAHAYRKTFQIPVVGITGTNGKTTTKELLSAMVSSVKNVHATEKNFNNEIGLPFTLLSMPASCETAVIEMGMNHPGEIERLSAITEPDIAIITSIGAGHLEHLGSIEGVARAKSEILRGMKPGGKLIINKEAPFSGMIIEEAKNRSVETITCSLSKGDVVPEKVVLLPGSVEVTLHGVTLSAPLQGEENALNLVLALAAMEEMGLSLEYGAKGLAGFSNARGRGSVVEGVWTVIDDSYNANPGSVTSSLKSLAALYQGRRKVVFLGDMLELGEEAGEFHFQMGKLAGELGIDALYAVGPLGKSVIDGARSSGMDGDNIAWFPLSKDCAGECLSLVKKNDVILVKGSRGIRMEYVVKTLEEGSV